MENICTIQVNSDWIIKTKDDGREIDLVNLAKGKRYVFKNVIHFDQPWNLHSDEIWNQEIIITTVEPPIMLTLNQEFSEVLEKLSIQLVNSNGYPLSPFQISQQIEDMLWRK